MLGSVAWVLLLAGCTANQHRSSADRQVYAILHQVERQTLGHTNEFTINTRYSGRRPDAITPAEIINDRLATNAQTLTLPAALRLAVFHSRTFQTEKERLYLTALTLTGERYRFAPLWGAGSTAEYERLSNGDKRGSVNSWLSVSQTLLTGGQLAVSVVNDLLRYYTGDPRRAAVSTVSANLLQPLLRGFGGGNLAAESLNQADRNVVYAVRDFEYFCDEFAVGVVVEYFNLLAQQDTVRNRYADYLSRGQATRRLEARAADRERLADVDKSRQAELTALASYIATAAAYQNALDQFKINLGLPVSERVQLDPTPLTELAAAGTVPVPLAPAAAFQFAVAGQPKLRNALERYKDSQRKVRVAANRLRADLNLFAEASLESERPTDYTRFDANNLRAGVGVELELPLDRLRQRNDYRAALIAFEAQVRTLGLTFDNLQGTIVRGLRNLELRRQTHEIQRQALTLAERRVDSAEMLMEAGRAEVRDLLEAQDALVAAQNAATAALVQYQQQRLQLLLELGMLDTAAEKFWLQDQVPSVARRTDPVPAEKTPVIPPDQIFTN